MYIVYNMYIYIHIIFIYIYILYVYHVFTVAHVLLPSKIK